MSENFVPLNDRARNTIVLHEGARRWQRRREERIWQERNLKMLYTWFQDYDTLRAVLHVDFGVVCRYVTNATTPTTFTSLWIHSQTTRRMNCVLIFF